MGKTQDTVIVAETFKELFEVVTEATYNHCKPLINQREAIIQKSKSNWLKTAIIYEAESFTRNFLKEAKIKDEKTKNVLLDSITRYRSLD